MQFITDAVQLNWPQNPLFKIGDKVVFLNDFTAVNANTRRKEIDLSQPAEVVSYLPAPFMYMIKFHDAAQTIEWRYMSVFEDEIEASRTNLKELYTYTVPEPGDISVSDPFGYMDARIDQGLYAPIFDIDSPNRHPDWNSHHPDVYAALEEVSAEESTALLDAFLRDVKRAYGFVEDTAEYANRVIAHKVDKEKYTRRDLYILLQSLETQFGFLKGYNLTLNTAAVSTIAALRSPALDIFLG